MRTEDRQLAVQLRQWLKLYSREIHPLPGISEPAACHAFIFQIIESIRRIRFVKQVAVRDISPLRADPISELFDPVRAAILNRNIGQFDEACWLVFLFTHFGKNRVSGYRLMRDIYGKLGAGNVWSWIAVSAAPLEFRHWLEKNMPQLQSGSVHRAFGNHRKYQSLNAWKENGTGAAVQSYVEWVKSAGSHEAVIAGAIASANGSPEGAFKVLYQSMAAVSTFGRTARFDYLSMIGKVGLGDIRPDSVHFGSATGPLAGAKLLFFNSYSADQSSRRLEELADSLASTMGIDKQAMEDSMCNWQKSPITPISFRG